MFEEMKITRTIKYEILDSNSLIVQEGTRDRVWPKERLYLL